MKCSLHDILFGLLSGSLLLWRMQALSVSFAQPFAVVSRPSWWTLSDGGAMFKAEQL
jgi:hypothetical protein